MIGDLFSVALYNPLYNGLIFLISVVPYADVGIAVIILTIAVRFFLLPLSMKAVKTQALVRGLESDLSQLREKFKDNKQEQARRTMELYREKGINPFSSFLLLFIQIPIIFALYWVFFRGGLPVVNLDILYSFISVPDRINTQFIGLIDILERNAPLAILAGVTQFFQIKLSMPKRKKLKSKTPSLKEDLARSFSFQMRYVLPVIVVVIAYVISAAVALYWTVSNIVSIAQELFVLKRLRQQKESESQTQTKEQIKA